MSSAVSFTSPSVGSSSVAARLSLRSASLSGGAEPWPGTTERSWVWTCDVTSITGDCWSAAHSTRSISAPYFGSRTRSATLALPVQVTLPGRCQSAAAKVGSGIHARVAPSIGSTRAVST